MPEITVDTSVTFDPRKNWYESAMLSGVSYWASEIEVNDDGITLIDTIEGKTRAATWQNIADAIVLIASGKYVRYDGTNGSPSEYAVKGATDLIHRPDDADWDADVDDLILQQATIGQVLYG